MKRRNYIPVETKRAAWRRAKGQCEECGMNLKERYTVHIPARKIEFWVLLWNGHECWRCHSVGRILEIADSQGCEYFYLDAETDLAELGEIVRKRYPFYRPRFSHSTKETYYENHCESCGVLQGKDYLEMWLADTRRFDTPDVTELIPEFVCHEPADSYPDKRFLPFQIHHRNNDPFDASLDNLQILCPPCHRKKHSPNLAAKVGAS